MGDFIPPKDGKVVKKSSTNSFVPPSDSVELKKKEASQSTSTPPKLDSGTSTGSSGGVNPRIKSFDGFSSADLKKMNSPEIPLPKINKKLENVINSPENVARRKEVQRKEVLKYRENTKLSDQEKQETQAELEAKNNQEGIWNNIKAFSKNAVNTVSDFAFKMTDEGSTPEDLKIDTDPFADEKKQAKEELKNNGNKKPSNEDVAFKAKQIYVDNINLEKKQQKINSYLENVAPETKSALKIDADERFTSLSKNKKEITNRISLNQHYFEQLTDDLNNSNITEEDRNNLTIERNKIAKYLDADYKKFTTTNDELGTAQDEFDAFKRNYNALDNTVSRALSSVANAGVSLYSGANYIANSLGANEEYKQEGVKQAKEFLQNKQEGFRPDNKEITLDNFFQYSTDLLANQTGTLVQVGTGGLIGVAALGTEQAGDTYSKMYQDQKKGNNYSPAQMVIAPFVSGLSTAILSELPTISTLRNASSVWKSALKETAKKELIDEAVKVTGKSILKNIAKDTGKEVATESMDNIIQNAIKRDILGDKKVGYFDNTIKTIKDTALLTGMIGTTGAMPHVAISAVKTFTDKAQVKKMDINAKKISELVKQLDNENIGETTKKVIKEQIDSATKESSEIINKTIDKIGKMPLEKIEKVYNNSKRIAEVQQEASDIKDDIEIDDIAKKTLLDGLKDEYVTLEKKNTNILNETNDNAKQETTPTPEAQPQAEVQKPSEAEKVDETAKSLGELNKKDYKKVHDAVPDDLPLNVGEEGGINKSIAEAYHKAKQDGSNPKLVKVIEELLGNSKQTPKPQEVSPVEDVVAPSVEEISDLEDRFIKSGISGNRSISELQSENNNKIEFIDLGDGLIAWKMPKSDKTTIQQYFVADKNSKSNDVHQIILNNKGEFGRINEPNVKSSSKVVNEDFNKNLNRLNEARKRIEKLKNEATPPTNTPADGNIQSGTSNVGEVRATEQEIPAKEGVSKPVDGGEGKGDASVGENNYEIEPYYKLHPKLSKEDLDNFDYISDAVMTGDYEFLPDGYSIKTMKSYRENARNYVEVEVTNTKGDKFYIRENTFDLRDKNFTVTTKPKSKGKQIEPHKEVNTDVETVKKELNLNEVDNLLYDELKDTPADKVFDKIDKIKDDKLGEIETIEKKMDDVDLKMEDNGEAIDKIDEDETLSAAKKKKAITVKEKEFKDLQKQRENLESEKEGVEKLISDIDSSLFHPTEDYNADKVSELINKVNTRLETRKSIKEGTNLFPEDANIPEFVAIKKELIKLTDEKTIAEFNNRTAEQIEESKPIIADIKSKAKNAERISKEELEKGIADADRLLDNKSQNFAIREINGRPHLIIIGEKPTSKEGIVEYEKNGFYINPQKGFEGLVTSYYKDLEILKNNIKPEYYNQIIKNEGIKKLSTTKEKKAEYIDKNGSKSYVVDKPKVIKLDDTSEKWYKYEGSLNGEEIYRSSNGWDYDMEGNKLPIGSADKLMTSNKKIFDANNKAEVVKTPLLEAILNKERGWEERVGSINEGIDELQKVKNELKSNKKLEGIMYPEIQRELNTAIQNIERKGINNDVKPSTTKEKIAERIKLSDAKVDATAEAVKAKMKAFAAMFPSADINPDDYKTNGFSMDAIIDMVAKAAKSIAKGGIVTSEHIKEAIDAFNEHFDDKIDPKAVEERINTKKETKKESSDSKESDSVDLLSQMTDVPNSGEIGKYMSRENIEESDEEEKFTTKQDYEKLELLDALIYGKSIVEQAKVTYGDNYIEELIKNINAIKNVDSKTLHIISLENDLRQRRKESTDIQEKEFLTEQINRLQPISQKLANTVSRALNLNRLRQLSATGVNPNDKSNSVYTKEELETKHEIAKSFGKDIDDIQEQYEENIDNFFNEDDFISEDFELNVPKNRRNNSDVKKDISNTLKEMRKALLDVAKGNSAMSSIPYAQQLAVATPYIVKLTSFVAELGIINGKKAVDYVYKEINKVFPGIKKEDVAEIIKKNNTVSKSNLTEEEIFQKKIDQKIAQTQKALDNHRSKKPKFALGANSVWSEELSVIKKELSDLRNEKNDERKKARELKQKATDLLIASGYVKEISVTKKEVDADGNTVKVKSTKNILDWKKLAGESGSVANISKAIQKALEGKGFSQQEITDVVAEMKTAIEEIKTSITEKSLTDLQNRNKISKKVNVNSEAKNLSQLYNQGIFDDNMDKYDVALNRVLGFDKFKEKQYQDLKDYSRLLSNLFSNKNIFNDNEFMDEDALKTQVAHINKEINKIVNKAAMGKGLTPRKVVALIRDYSDMALLSKLLSLKQLIENPWSGFTERKYQQIGSSFDKIKLTPELRSYIDKGAWSVFRDISLSGSPDLGDSSFSDIRSRKIDDAIRSVKTKNKTIDNVKNGIAGVISGTMYLNGADAFNKVKIVESVFAKAMIDILSNKSYGRNNTMTVKEATKFVSEALTGESFDKAIVKAKEIIAETNKEAGKEILPFTNANVFRLAMDAVKDNLTTDGVIDKETVKAVFTGSFKAAGSALGHESNNAISELYKSTSQIIDRKVRESIKKKDYVSFTKYVTLNIMKNLTAPFVSGRFNWVVLTAQKSGANLGLSMLVTANKKNQNKIDFSTEEGIKNLSEAVHWKIRHDLTVKRSVIGLSLNVLAITALAATGGDDELDKILENSPTLKKLFKWLGPPLLNLYFASQKGGKQEALDFILDFYSVTGNEDRGSVTSQFNVLLDDNSTAKKEAKAWGYLGKTIGKGFDTPIPWRLGKDIKNIKREIAGEDQYMPNYNATSFLSGLFQGGYFESIGMREILSGHKEEKYVPKGEKGSPFMPKMPSMPTPPSPK